jgi:hypothetical protein
MMDRPLSKRSPLLLRWSAVGTLFALTLAGAVLPAAAQVPAPAQRGDKVLPPIEILAELVGDSVRCSPAEVRLPAQDEIDLRLVNRSDQPLTFAGQEIFSDRHLVRLEGDVVHAASDQGYVVKPNATGRIILRTPPAGQYRYTCASSRTQGNPTGGTLTVVAAQ